MIKNLPILLLLFFSVYTNGQTIFYTKTTIPSSLKETYQGMFDMQLIAEDVAALLSKASGKNYRSRPLQKEDEGIILKLDPDFKHTSHEAGKILYVSPKKIIITAKYSSGISFAVYSWLQQLGFQFSLPGNEWMTVPKLKSLKPSFKEKIFFPAFRLRTFYASGGMYPVKGLDEDRKNEKEWWLWYRRNRMGCDYYKIDGHMGELFNIMHKNEIEDDPSILAPVNGIRKYSVGGKLDPTNSRGVNLFSNWIIHEYTKEQKTLPSFLPHKKYYSVDPGDGLDYCHTRECEQQFKSVSDQVFYIANITATKIRKTDARAGVSLMAYTERSDTPSIKIEPNVHVMIVPTAFQSVSTSTELMQRWRKKTANISQYDFLNIGVWSLDMPFFDMKRYISRLHFLKKLQIEGLSYETSMSKFASGIQQYFILKFLSEPYADPENLLKAFCRINFQQAAVPVEKLFREWYFSDVHIQTNKDRESFLPDELGRFIHYITEAESMVNNEIVRERILQLKAYVVYLCEFYHLFHSGEKINSDKTMEYTWNVYSKNILHNTQLNDMLMSFSSDPGSWNYRTGDKFSVYKNFDENQLKILFEKYRSRFPYYNVPVYLNDNFFQKNISYSADSILIRSMDEDAFGKYVYPVSFYNASPSVLKIRYTTNASSVLNEDKIAIIACESDDYAYIETRFIYPKNKSGIVSFLLPAKGHYRLMLSYFQAKPIEFVLYPSSQLFYLHKKSILMNALQLQTEGKQLSGKYGQIAFIQPDSGFILRYNYATTYMPVRFFEQTGKEIKSLRKKERLSGKSNFKSRFLYYTNEVYRWPPVLENSSPYFFFLKPPKT